MGAGLSHGPDGGLGRPMGSGGGELFPDLSPRERPVTRAAAPRIALSDALRAPALGEGASSNRLVAAAAPLLILLGRLRTGLVDMQAGPLMEHVYHQIEGFERQVRSAGVPDLQARVAKYILAGTADDIVQNLPGADRGRWAEYSMAARMFGTRDTGVGIFHETEKAMQAPAEHYDLLELILACLSLGFEGEYRTRPGGADALARVRRSIYETLRRVRPRPPEDISPVWAPVVLQGRRLFAAIPVWAIAGLALAALVAFFATLSTLLNRQGWAVADTLYGLHADTPVTLERGPAAQPFVAPAEVAQLDRIRTALAPEIEAGQVDVGTKGDFIFVRVGNLLLFDSGSSDVREDFAPLADRIAEVLDAEGGPVRVLGYTDSVPPSGRGRYKTNLDLSVARAEGVADLLRARLSDPSRIAVEGRGEADPIGDNATPEGRAQNRRVEVLIAREGTFQ